VQLGEPYSSASDWRVRPERPSRKDSCRVGNSDGDRRLSSGRRRRDRLGGRRDIHHSFPKSIRNSPCDAYLPAHQGGTVAKANANRHEPRNARSLEKREADARQADPRQADADEADVREAEAEADARQAKAETRQAETRKAKAQAREAEAEADTCEAEAQGNTGTRPGVVEPPGSHADRDANGKLETEPYGDRGGHAHGNANSDAKRGSDA
jgi:hypothetical protein